MTQERKAWIKHAENTADRLHAIIDAACIAHEEKHKIVEFHVAFSLFLAGLSQPAKEAVVDVETEFFRCFNEQKVLFPNCQ